MKYMRLLVWLTQLGLSVVAPLGGFVCLALWLRSKCNLGTWVVVAGVILGLLCAVDGLRTSLKSMERMAKELTLKMLQKARLIVCLVEVAVQGLYLACCILQ